MGQTQRRGVGRPVPLTRAGPPLGLGRVALSDFLRMPPAAAPRDALACWNRESHPALPPAVIFGRSRNIVELAPGRTCSHRIILRASPPAGSLSGSALMSRSDGRITPIQSLPKIPLQELHGCYLVVVRRPVPRVHQLVQTASPPLPRSVTLLIANTAPIPFCSDVHMTQPKERTRRDGHSTVSSSPSPSADHARASWSKCSPAGVG